ncbi:OmpA family protein [Hyphomicrobium sp.]|uniref:OmpA family protein n=1 Tax=Hyphomicrobium sp. TaxID=82 RepID=UPI003F6F242D
MLRRGALVLFLIVGVGIAAILAAGSFGITWPWQQQTAVAPADPGSKENPSPAATASQSREVAPTEHEAAKAIEETTAALSPEKPGEAPKQGSVALDISRVSPDGPSVFAGRAEPDSYVTVLENGKPAGTVKADANGDWSLSTEHRFATTDPKLTFEASATPPAPPAAETPKVAEKPAEPAQRSASVVANDVMKKFEDLVAKAREDAKKEQDAKAQSEANSKGEAKPQNEAKVEPKPDTQELAVAPDAQPAPVAKPEQPAQHDESASSAANRATANAGSSAGASSSATTNTHENGSAPEKPVTTAEAPIAPGSQPGKTEAIPVPIMFVYNEATLTPEGQHAASLLLEYLTLKRLSAVELTGHADERGTSEYNMDLSRDRLATVSDLLKNGGYSGELKLTPKGKSEPFMGVDRHHYSGEALFQLDRRVELRVAR